MTAESEEVYAAIFQISTYPRLVYQGKFILMVDFVLHQRKQANYLISTIILRQNLPHFIHNHMECVNDYFAQSRTYSIVLKESLIFVGLKA